MVKKALLLLLLAVPLAGYSQIKFNFRFWEDSLIRLRDRVMTVYDETEKMALNEDFMNLLESVLLEPNSFKFEWDSVANFSVIASPDKTFKIYTWYLLKNNLSVENFGFLQVYNDSRKKYVIYPLYDKRTHLDYAEEMIGDHNTWYGAVYYKIIPLKAKAKTYYTLLGWNGNNLFTNQKVIEVLHFKKDMTPVFGARIFKKYPKKVSRVILDYHKDASLSLKYEKQSYDVSTGKRDQKTRKVIYETVVTDMIIFDHLIPMEDHMESIPAFTVPESSMQQGFIPHEGNWLFLKEVNGRNPDITTPQPQAKRRTYYTPPN